MMNHEVIEYVADAREHSIDLMLKSESQEVFFFYKGKVYAYNELLRILLNDEY